MADLYWYKSSARRTKAACLVGISAFKPSGLGACGDGVTLEGSPVSVRGGVPEIPLNLVV